MTLSPGQLVLHYRLDTPIGQGGMGVVWRAHDTTLGRDVALKFLPEQLTGDAERMARLEREARLLASLNHPRIASIYGFHHAAGARFLAMELVEGEDLSQRLARGPLGVAEAMPLALQIAEALEHAHEKGVIHRDLKPANIKLDSSGGAKVLDFGLAKAIEGDPIGARSGSGLTHSPTITGGMTAANVLLGTAAYMSPEQARGQLADRRADIWSFGVVLTEMLTGKRLFEGDTISDTLAAVLRSDLDPGSLPRDTPPRLRTLLRRCLERDAKRRLRDIGEARIALDEMLRGVGDDGAASAAAAPAAARGLPLLPAAAALVVVALAAFAAARATAPAAREVPLRKFAVEPDTSNGTPTSPVISPDGSLIASLVGGRIAIRDLTRFESRSFTVEPNAQMLFWSPDSRDLGYLTGSKVVRLSATDGQRQVVSDTRAEFTGGSGGWWTSRGTILFSRGDSLGVLEVSDRGGDPHVVMPADPGLEGDVHEPSELPGSRGILFASHTRHAGISQLWLWSKGKRTLLLDLKDQTISLPRYSPSGHIVFHRSPNTPGIWALPFSLSKLAVTGEPFLVVADAVLPSVSLDGTLCYRPGRGSQSTQLVWLDRDGAVTPIGEPALRPSYALDADPTGPRVVRGESEGSSSDLWVYDYARSTRTRLTFGQGDEDLPDWSPDGRWITYNARAQDCTSAECWTIMVQPSGGGRADTLASGGALAMFTPDSREVLYTGLRESGRFWDLTRVPADRSSPPVTLLRGNPRVLAGRVSPDGSLLAYVSNESERYEVYLTRYPSCEGRWQVSSNGGQWPRWGPKGDRLYFSNGDEILQVEVSAGATPALGNPQVYARRPHTGPYVFGFDGMYAFSPDGSRILTARSPEANRQSPRLAVVQNWAAEFRKGKK